MVDQGSAAVGMIAIHQPNFFPWLGYFDKIARSDRFIILDHVQRPKGSGSWINRVKLLLGGEGRWWSAPIRREEGLPSILETRFDSSPWRRKSLATLQAAYGKAPRFRETMEVIEPLILNEEDSVGAFNIRAIVAISQGLGLDTSKLLRSSQLGCEGTSNGLLISLTKAAGGDIYLCGGGASGYQEDDLYAEAGIDLRYQSFAHPVYPQHGSAEFIGGLSIVDTLMNIGFDETRALLARS